MKKKATVKKGSLIIKIMIVVIIGVVVISEINILLVNSFSKKFFQSVYGESQEKNIVKIEKDLESYMGQIEKTIDQIRSSYNIRRYLLEENMTSAEESNCVYKMQKDFQGAVPDELSGTTIMLVSKSGNISSNNSDLVTLDADEIMKNETFAMADENKNVSVYHYIEKGFTSGTKDGSVLLGVRALATSDDKEAYGYVVVLLPDKELDSFYLYGQNQYNNIYILDNAGIIVSSTDKKKIGTSDKNLKNITDKMLENENVMEHVSNGSKQNMVLCKKIPYINYALCFVIDYDSAIDSLYDISTLTFYTIIVALLVLFVIFIIIRSTMSPLRKLGEKMSYVTDGDFNHYAEVTGDGEIRELAKSYNQMLKDINHYVDSIIEIEKQKRQAEIRALQMQINPHYIYNTLTSIKWLILQKDTEKSTKAIDAFIQLLRSTISKSGEYITISEEVVNLKNYMYINAIRYGEKIKTEFFVSVNEPDNLLLPKMILQPFIENAFFHAFPQGQNGKILVCIREKDNKLKFEIMDDGIGMDREQVENLKKGNPKSKGEHFTGIGINNIRDRLELIYGNECTLDIRSTPGEGTTVSVTIPRQHKKVE